MKTKSLKNFIPIFLALIVMLLWGSLYPSVKLSYKNFEIDTTYYPNLLVFAGVRFTISGALITLVLSVKAKRIPTVKTKNEWIGILLVGVFAVIINYACTFLGLSLVESSKTALMKQSGVLLFIVFSALIFKEDKLTVGKGIGAALGLASIIILNSNQLGISMGLGEIVVIISSFGSVISSVICKKLLKNTDAVLVTGYSQLFGGAVLLVVGLIFGGSITLKEFGDFALLAYILFATCASYSLWYMIVQKFELSKLFIVKLSEPMFAAIIGAILLGENLLQLHYILAFVCIAVAVIVSNLHFKRKRKEQEEKPQTEEESVA